MKVFAPDLYVNTVANIDPAALQEYSFEEGAADIAAMGWDLDGTLLDHEAERVPDEHLAVMQAASEMGMQHLLISNAGSKERMARAEMIARSIRGNVAGPVELLMSGMKGMHRKPVPSMYLHGARILSVAPESIVFTDDQWLKGVLGAKLSGYGRTILVAKFGPNDDPGVAAVQRPIEERLRPLFGMPRRYEDFPDSLTIPQRPARRRPVRAPLWAGDWDPS